MPRKPREHSESGVYHVMLRGINRQDIFLDEEDNLRFLETVYRYKVKSKLQVLAWCILSNHVHLLIKEGCEAIHQTIKRIAVSYTQYYRWKYNYVGHLFQDRFKSEIVESDGYLFTVTRYIHQNPIKAGVVKRMDEWKWSSCNGYYGKVTYPGGLLDMGLILAVISENKDAAIKQFKAFNEENTVDACLDFTDRNRLSDEEAKIKIENSMGGVSISDIRILPKLEKEKVINTAKALDGITHKQIARLLGVSSRTIFESGK